MLTRSQAFQMEVDAKVASRMREVWHDLEPGDLIVVMHQGKRQLATFMGHLAPDALIQTPDGREVLINRYCFVGLHRKKGAGDGKG